jgi:hypothetical protein
MHKSPVIRIAAWSAIAVLAVPLMIRLGVLLGLTRAGLADAVEFIYDDGYYYLGVAANLAETGRSTLDGMSATNGYQPLWLLCLAGLAKLVGTNTWTFFVASCALIYAIAVAAPLAAMYRSRNAAWQPIALCVSVGLCIVMIQQPSVFLQGLEPILFAPVVLPLIVLIERESAARDWIWISSLLAIGFLVRLDALSLYFSTVLVLGFTSTPRGGRWWGEFLSRTSVLALRLSIVVLPTVGIYLLINMFYFDSAVPVSGLAKLIGGPKFSNWGVAWMFFDHWRSLALVLIILAPLEWIARRVAAPSALFYRSLAIVCIAMIMQCVYYCALSAWNVWPWYAYLVAIFMALIIARIVYLAAMLFEFPRQRLPAAAAMALIAAWACGRSVDFVRQSMPAHPRSSELTFNQATLKMLDAFFPSSERKMLVAMGDRAGGLAYWGRNRLSVVQTEGLTLDMGYIRARLANRAAEYLEERFAIDYLIVDREYVPQVTAAGGERHYVVAEPIQGRITSGPVPTFCFPEDAVRYRDAYAAVWGTNLRLAFAFAKRVPCSQAALDLIRSVEQGQGLRQFSLPTEYLPSAGGPMNKGREDADRARARRWTSPGNGPG